MIMAQYGPTRTLSLERAIRRRFRLSPDSWFNLWMILPALLLLGLLVIYPLLYSILISVQTDADALTLSNYLALARDSVVFTALRNTVAFTVAAVATEFVLGLGLALALESFDFRGKRIVRSLLLLPVMMAPVVAGLEWRWLYNDQFGLLGFLISSAGFTPPLWLASPSFAMPSVIITDVWMAMPFSILVFASALNGLPQEPYEAARIDGASSWQLFRYLTIPFLRPAMLVVLLIRTIDAFRMFDIVFVLTKGGPGYATETLTMYAYRLSFSFLEFGKGAALSFVLLLVVTFVSLGYIAVIERR